MAVNTNLTKQGFSYIPQMISPMLCEQLKNAIDESLHTLIKQHACSEQVYFSTVNRWPLKSLVTHHLQQDLIKQLMPVVELFSELTLAPFELDILYKSPYASLGTPCHQDIAYAYERPYAGSTWIALTNVTLVDSPLQLLPGSHYKSITPAIDFWQPGFVDEFRQTLEWQKQAVTLTALPGDGVWFSSQLWHGSLAHHSTQPRLTVAIRWGNDELTYPKIPLPKTIDFGMWNCGQVTHSLLQQGLKELYNLRSVCFLSVIQLWQAQIATKQLPFSCNVLQAQHALKQLQILNEAYQNYQGGDGQGIVYAKVWKCFLRPLKDYLINQNIQP